MKFDINNILNSMKIIPVFLERKNCDPCKLPPYSIEIHPNIVIMLVYIVLIANAIK